jgi:HEAT repeat protein
MVKLLLRCGAAMLKLSQLPRTLQAALRDAEHDRFEVRLSAVRDLGRIGAGTGDRAARAIDALVALLAEDGAPGIRAEAAVALADAGAQGALEAVLRALNDDHPRVRQMALVALGEIGGGDVRARQAVERALSDRAAEIRFQALVAFHRLAGDEALEAVAGALEDEDAHIRYVAWRICEERWVESGQATQELLARARDALGDEAAEVRLAAAIVLGRAGDDFGADALAEAVNAGTGARELEDQQTAIELAGELRIEKARRGLERRAFGVFGVSRDAFAWQARVALARMGDARARAGILRGLAGWTRDGRTLAVAAAGRARLAEAKPTILAMRGDAARADPEAVEDALALLGPAPPADR